MKNSAWSLAVKSTSFNKRLDCNLFLGKIENKNKEVKNLVYDKRLPELDDISI